MLQHHTGVKATHQEAPTAPQISFQEEKELKSPLFQRENPHLRALSTISIVISEVKPNKTFKSMSNCPEISFPVRSTNTELDLGLQMQEIAVETFPSFSIFFQEIPHHTCLD